jgi:hypothetical protein
MIHIVIRLDKKKSRSCEYSEKIPVDSNSSRFTSFSSCSSPHKIAWIFTPQQDGKMERGFANLYRIMRAMILTSGMDLDQRSKLCVEVPAISTKLSNIVVVSDNKNPYERFYNNESDYVKHLRSLEKWILLLKNLHRQLNQSLQTKDCCVSLWDIAEIMLGMSTG